MDTIKEYGYKLYKKISYCKSFNCEFCKVRFKKYGRKKLKGESAYIGEKYDKQRIKIWFIGINPNFSHPYSYITKNYKGNSYKCYRNYINDYYKAFKGEEYKGWNKQFYFIGKFYGLINNRYSDINSLKKKLQKEFKLKHEPVEWLKSIAFVNRAKCAVKKKNKKTKKWVWTTPPPEMEEHCSNNYLKKELKILKPDVIILMGKTVIENFYNLILNKQVTYNCKKPIRVKPEKINGKKVILVNSHHCSFRGCKGRRKDKDISRACQKVRRHLRKSRNLHV